MGTLSSPSNLQQAREAKGLTQDAVAEKLGVTRNAVSQWEVDGGPNPLGPARRLLALLYDLPLETIDAWCAARRSEAA